GATRARSNASAERLLLHSRARKRGRVGLGMEARWDLNPRKPTDGRPWAWKAASSKLHPAHFHFFTVLFQDNRVSFCLFLWRARELRHRHVDVRFASKQVRVDGEVVDDDAVRSLLPLLHLIALRAVALGHIL